MIQPTTVINMRKSNNSKTITATVVIIIGDSDKLTSELKVGFKVGSAVPDTTRLIL